MEKKRAEPRSSSEIFDDLQKLTHSPGALHEISGIIYRDWVISVNVKDGKVAESPERRWSTGKLNKNELMLLLGLMVQSTSDQTYTVQNNESNFAAQADQLLRELHDRIIFDSYPTFNHVTGKFNDRPDSIGLFAREAIYHGADSFYLHQFLGFSRLRYREDASWLLQNAGLSIRPIIDIAKFIVDQINSQMNAAGHLRKTGHDFSNGELTSSLLIAKANLRKKFGSKADAFLSKFAGPITGANSGFTNPFAINDIAIAPIISLRDYIYVPNQYRLYESIYESPFYWMMADRAYVDKEAEHRGTFLEKTSAHILRKVFGSECVYENVKIIKNTRDIVGEIDVVVLYGEFVLVVQAKSKRVTLKARAGDTEALRADFRGAIQAPYQQALDCIDLMKSGLRCLSKDGKELTIHSLPRYFPIIVLSDPFPSSTALSGKMLERGDSTAPVIWDIAVLDCVARLLPAPIEFIFYLKKRSEVFDNVLSDSEYNYLGYHIQSKLTLPPDVDGMLLDRSFATIVDDYMISADVGFKADRPLGVFERAKIPIISDLLAKLRLADPRIASVVMDLYDFSTSALEELGNTVIGLRTEVALTGKAIKAFSIPTRSGGLTYAVTKQLDREAARAAEAIGSKHKYDTKSDRWYVILDSITTENPLDGLLPLIWPWNEDQEEALASQTIGKIFNSRRQESEDQPPKKTV